MNIYIDNRSGAPIYDQIYSQIKAQIVCGEFEADDALPSIRNLAKELKISAITTKRAYDELEREGYIYTVAAKGCFVAPKSAERMREESIRKIEEYMQEIKGLSVLCKLNNDEIMEMLRKTMEDTQ